MVIKRITNVKKKRINYLLMVELKNIYPLIF